MASNSTRFMSILDNGVTQSEYGFEGTNGYSNALVFRSAGSGSKDDIQLIIAGSNYFDGDSTYDSAPIGSIGISKAGGSESTMYLKFSTGSAWQAVGG